MQAQADPSLTADDRDGPIGWDALSRLDALEVARRNADLTQMGRLIFSVGGAPIRFERDAFSESELSASPPAIWLCLNWSGLPLIAAVSPALAEAVTQSLANVALEQLGTSGIELFAQLMLTSLLPTGLILRQAALERDALSPRPQAPEPLGTWRGRHRDSGEASGHAVTLWAAPGFPLAALLGACAGWATSRQPSPLAGMPIALPLVAARWSVDAAELADLAVGDVLLLG